MIRKALWFLSIFLIFVSACAPASAPSAEKRVTNVFDQGAIPEAIAPAPREVSGEFAFQEESVITTDRLVIKNASLEIVVDDPEKSMDTIARLAETMGGYVVSANLYQNVLSNGVEVPRASITIRVPADKLNEALAKIEAESDREPLNKNIQSQDITSDYTDLQSRLRNLEAAEEQLIEIMNRATRTEDVLNVFNQLTQIREQIEVIKGQIKYYDQSVQLSSISVELIANEAVQPIAIGGWQPVGVVKDAIEALIRGLQIIVNAIIWLGLFVIPILVVILLPVFLIVRYIIRRRQRAGVTPPSPQASS